MVDGMDGGFYDAKSELWRDEELLKDKPKYSENNNHWEMNLGARYVDYQRNDMIFMILIYKKVNLY